MYTTVQKYPNIRLFSAVLCNWIGKLQTKGITTLHLSDLLIRVTWFLNYYNSDYVLGSSNRIAIFFFFFNHRGKEDYRWKTSSRHSCWIFNFLLLYIGKRTCFPFRITLQVMEYPIHTEGLYNTSKKIPILDISSSWKRRDTVISYTVVSFDLICFSWPIRLPV